ncbi:MAG: PorT family protein [Flammeovirgaceae bacterium]|nr:PorT family protein [Flammeovirgaceae bacterium]
MESFGVFGGFNIPFTIDQGLQQDPRYYGKLTLRGTPFGVSYGYDHVGYGFLITPSYIKAGQRFVIQNTSGGEVGYRDVLMDYISVPVALKLHINDLSFFRLSMVASLNFNYMINGREVETYSASKLNYPPNVIIPNEPGYVEDYDGVFVPDVDGLEYVTKDKFQPFQLFAAIGVRADIEINEDWGINLDGRANFGIFDPRKKEYTDALQVPGDVPDIYGPRREIYLGAMIGVSRLIQIKKDFKARSSSSPKKKKRK